MVLPRSDRIARVPSYSTLCIDFPLGRIADGVPTPRVRVALRRKGLRMFKVGKTYKLWMWEDSHDGGIVTARGSCKVTKVDMPLVTIDQAGTETIINMHSPTFSRAKLEPSSSFDQGQRAQVLAIAQRRVEETKAWGEVAASTEAAPMQDFLSKWPDGQHAVAARARIKELASGARRRWMLVGAGRMVAVVALLAGIWWGYLRFLDWWLQP